MLPCGRHYGGQAGRGVLRYDALAFSHDLGEEGPGDLVGLCEDGLDGELACAGFEFEGVEHEPVVFGDAVLGVDEDVRATQPGASVRARGGMCGEGALCAVLDVVVEEGAPFWAAAVAVPGGVDEDEVVAGVSGTDAVEVERACAALGARERVRVAWGRAYRGGAGVGDVVALDDLVDESAFADVGAAWGG